MRKEKFFLRNLNDEHMRYISAAEGEGLVSGHQASRVYRERQHGKQREIIGYRLCMPVKPGQPGVATIRMSESMASAGVYGKSRTAKMYEPDRRKNMRKVRYPDGVVVEVPEMEDFIEQAQGKITLWALERDTKAVRVGPLPDAAAMKLAAELAVQSRLYPD